MGERWRDGTKEGMIQGGGCREKGERGTEVKQVTVK